eukprot:CAMPEP_0195293060 /NCGR_PEP_ID=MMETSP0707-20130614/11555_1 /TAXON_ID=33640 /ORGANISM="Asterionellopsis glacialis, Strain CCMP134" /LENGTH=584 /DNA_ID=CAMNT_0040353689 /DNA_START=1 /DNA_END=1755 /DNA_ORIENTATION=+
MNHRQLLLVCILLIVGVLLIAAVFQSSDEITNLLESSSVLHKAQSNKPPITLITKGSDTIFLSVKDQAYLFREKTSITFNMTDGKTIIVSAKETKGGEITFKASTLDTPDFSKKDKDHHHSSDDDDDDDDSSTDQEQNHQLIDHSRHHHYSDRFQWWSRRSETSLETIRHILNLATEEGDCKKNTFHFPVQNGISSLDQVAAAIHRKLKTGDKKVIVAVLGDSVAADPNGFVQALQSFLSTSKVLDFEVEVRNFAKGGTGPRFTFFCNQLQGDEDVVVYECVRPYEPKSVIDLVTSLKNTGYGIIITGWRGPVSYNLERSLYGFEVSSNSLNIPFINLNENRDYVKACLPPNVNTSKTEKEQLYRDEVHPNRLGELILATMIGRTIELAVEEHLLKYVTNSTAPKVVLPDVSLSKDSPICYSRLLCNPESPRAKGMNHCLSYGRMEGFNLLSLEENGKMWLEGANPGDIIEVVLDQNCTEIVLFHNLRVTNGMVQVVVDGEILPPEKQNLRRNKINSTLPQGVLDGWYEGFWWLPPERGALVEPVIAHDLEPKPHTVKLKVLNTTHSKDGSHKFDFTSLACRRG